MEDLNFEGSFSFAGSDFIKSSSFSFFSDDEDDHGDSDTDEYFEIALDQYHHHKSTLDDDEEGDFHDLDYLRISFSSTIVPYAEFSDLVNSAAATDETVTETSSSSSSSSSSTFTAESSSNTETETSYKDRAALGSESSGGFHKTRRKRSSHLRILDTLPMSMRDRSSETGKRSTEVEDDNEKQLTIHSHSGDLLRNRKASKTRAAKNGGNGMMMKLLIKIRGIKLGTLLTSFLKPRGGGVVVVHHDNIINHTTATTTEYYNEYKKKTSEISAEYYRRLFMKPLDKWLIQRNRDHNGTATPTPTPASSPITIKSGGGDDHKYYSNKLMMNINGAMRGVVRAMSFAKVDIIKSSPLDHHHHHNINGSPTDHHHKLYTRDNSIQAAIAHCKSSS